MKRIVCLAALTLLISFNAFSPSIAHADTYQQVLIGPAGAPNSNDRFLYGMDDYGDFVTELFQCTEAGPCFWLFVGGQQVATVYTTPPALSYDNGIACGVGV